MNPWIRDKKTATPVYLRGPPSSQTHHILRLVSYCKCPIYLSQFCLRSDHSRLVTPPGQFCRYGVRKHLERTEQRHMRQVDEQKDHRGILEQISQTIVTNGRK